MWYSNYFLNDLQQELHLWPSSCLSISVSACVSFHLSVYLSVSLGSYPTLCISVCMPGFLSNCLYICLSAWVPIQLSVCLGSYPTVCISVCLPGFLSNCVYFCLSACVSIHMCVLKMYALHIQEAKKKDEMLLKFPEKLQDVQSAARYTIIYVIYLHFVSLYFFLIIAFFQNPYLVFTGPPFCIWSRNFHMKRNSHTTKKAGMLYFSYDSRLWKCLRTLCVWMLWASSCRVGIA